MPRKIIICCCIGLLLFSPEIQASCRSTLTDYFQYNYQKAGEYLTDVRQTRGLRLFLTNIEDREPDKRWIGFFQEHIPSDRESLLGRLLDGIPNFYQPAARWFSKIWFRHPEGRTYNLHILGGLYYNLIGRGVRVTSRHIFGRTKDFSLLVKIPCGLFIMGFGIKRIIRADEKAKIRFVENRIEEYGPEWDVFMERDYLYHDAREALEKGEMNQPKAREWTAVRHENLKAYYAERKKNQDPKIEDTWMLMESPFFEPIQKILLDGISRLENFYYSATFNPKISAAQLRDLIDLQHGLIESYRQLNKVFEEFGGTERAKRLDPSLQLIKLYLEKDPFAKALIQHQKEGTLTTNELIYRLGEDLWWQARFKEYEILGVIRLDPADPEKKTRLTLERIRMETIDEINKKLN